MAVQEIVKDIQLIKGTNITVFVDEALQDMLIVTYEYGPKSFKGVLLDSNKRNIPCGVPNLHPVFGPPKCNTEEDPMYSVNQRYAYLDSNYAKSKNVKFPSRYKNNKMTVRLRPRQVLCSKCKGICNENSENVSKKRKSQTIQQPLPAAKRSADAPVTRSVYSLQKAIEKDGLRPSLIPKISRLLPQDISEALNGKLDNLTTRIDVRVKVLDKIKEEVSSDNESKPVVNPNPPSATNEHLEAKKETLKAATLSRNLRKKRSVGSMEDLWDESVFEENAKAKLNKLPSENDEEVAKTDEQSQSAPNANTTRTIKISYGPQGEGTVLKIPAPIKKFSASDDSEENIDTANCDMNKEGVDTKAARKALKRARKKARQTVVLPAGSPSYISALSPRYSIGGTSPRYSMVSGSPRHNVALNSPRFVTTSSEIILPKRRKHKLKRKKKHRDVKEKKHKSEEEPNNEENAEKDMGLTQKLLISLRRHNNTYTYCQNESDQSEEDEQNEQVPNFPSPQTTTLPQAGCTQTLSSALGADGQKLLIGDVIWGKIHGFPWWPGKILSITICGNQSPQARVAWYGSSTCSMLQCDQLSKYLDNFKIRYNKKKKGAYKEAIRQATSEAKDDNKLSDISVASSTNQNIMTVPPPALASPREIDVVS